MLPLCHRLAIAIHTPVVERYRQIVFRVIQAGVVEVQQGADATLLPQQVVAEQVAVDQGGAGGSCLPVTQQCPGPLAVVVWQLVQVASQCLQPLTFAGQGPQGAGITLMQLGEQRAHLSATVQIHGKIMLPGQARHQHRRFAGHRDLVLAAMIRQRGGHRQTLFSQVRQQHQIRGESRVGQGFENRQH